MKKPLIITISLAAAVAVVTVSIGGYHIYKSANTRVEVSPVSSIYAPIWEDNSSYGIVTTDLTQDVYIKEDQVIQDSCGRRRYRFRRNTFNDYRQHTGKS